MIKKIILHLKWMLAQKGFFDSWTDERYLKLTYRLMIGKKLNLNNPQTFNEKLQWLKIHDRNYQYTSLVDKIEAKKIVGKVIGEEYIIPTLEICDSFDEIDWEKLPNRFIIKCNHNSGGVIVVNDKKDLDKDSLRTHFNKLLKKNYYYNGREYPYKNIKPKIMIEENIQNANTKKQIDDYKLMCFNGKVKCSFVCSNRDSKEGLCVNFYDEDWNPMPFERHYPKNKQEFPKPKEYNKMVELAEKLSKNIPFVRVDFYVVNDKIYFGELTFYPGSGMEEFTPDEWDYILGTWLDISKIR